MNPFSLSRHFGLKTLVVLVCSIGFFWSSTFALPLWATCETQNCDAWLVCKNSNGQNVPPGAWPWSCVVNCDNDNFCDSGETVQYCSDCHCGNGVCEPSSPWIENHTNCPVDCYCGNGTVEAGENNCTCPADVPATTCGDGCCVGTENSSNCSQDCGAPPACWDGDIDPGETFCNCPWLPPYGDVQDAACGDGCCSVSEGETVSSCYQDCGSCGDGQCTSPETLSTCPSDCRVCGDGQCTAPWENGSNCVDCQIPSCTISGPQVCRNNTYTFDCNHYYANGPISMTSSNPAGSSSSDSISVTIWSSAQWVMGLTCFNNGNQLCSTSRAIWYCGDGVFNCNEACDYWWSFPNACNPTTCERKPCTTAADCWWSLFVCANWFCDAWYCGDGVISLGEQCEENSDCSVYGNGYTCNGCYCSPGWWGGGNPVCGNYITELWEQCDDGDSAHPWQGGTIIEMDTCDGTTCTKVNVCGDGIIGPGEQCDNGGQCTAWWWIPPSPADPYCDAESDCNYASNRVCAPRWGDGCSVTCQIEPGRICGDGITVTGNNEQCDDGNTTNGDGCDNNCTTTACGNGIVTWTEECDDGNTIPNDGCSYTGCQWAFCGDGILQENGADGQPWGGDDEVCDDGNEVNGDGCTADCSYCGLHCPDCSVKLPNLDLFFVVDTSASMLEWPDNNFDCNDGICKLIDAKTAIELFVNALNPAEDRVALIEFNSTATVKYWLSSNTWFSHMLAAVNALQATWLTNMWWAMSTLWLLAGSYTYTGRQPVVIFLGDGQPTVPGPDPVQYTKDQATLFHTNFPGFKVFSIGLDLAPLTPTNQAIAIDLLQNYIASTPADFYQWVPWGRGAVCGGGKWTAAWTTFWWWLDSVFAAWNGLAETYGQIWNQMCQCGLTPPTPVCSDTVKFWWTSVWWAPKSWFCSWKPSQTCSTNLQCGVLWPCITSNNLCGGREWYSCDAWAGAKCEGCGDGILGTGEQCDLWTKNGEVGAWCDAFCKSTSYCGDGIVQDCEVCDDGNYEAGDGCSPWCTVEPDCWDGILNACGALTWVYLPDGNEEGYCSWDPTISCNDKWVNCPAGKWPCLEATYCNLWVQGTCLHDATITCTSHFDCKDGKIPSVCVWLALAQIPDPSAWWPIDLKEICGWWTEFCDDGNTVWWDGCPANCTATCGNGIVEGNEACDDGNTVNTDSCTSGCANAYCGDGITRLGIEQCDDGKNGDDSDGCTDQCTTGQCDPTTTYASGAVPGWYCPQWWILQWCPGAYLCVRQSIAPIICTECGNGTKDPTEECDRSDPADQHHDACNQFCLLNYCGDGEVFTWISTWFVWNWIASWSTSTRPVLTFSRVISQGQWGFTPLLSTNAGFWKTMTLLNDTDNDGFEELAVGAIGQMVQGQTGHGQIFWLSFDTWGKVDTVRSYFSWVTLWSQPLVPGYLESIGNIENSIFWPGTFPVHKEFIFSANGTTTSYVDRLLWLFIGKESTYVGTNTWSVMLQGFASTQITDLATVGDIDNNGVDDFAVLFVDGAETKLAIIRLTGNPALHLSTQVISSLWMTWWGQGKLSPIWDSNGDLVEDLMLSRYSESTEQMVIKRVLLNNNGTLNSQSTFHTLTINKATFSYAVYGQDVDENGTKDILTVRVKETPYTMDWLLLLMNSNRTISSATLLNFGDAKAQGDLAYFAYDTLFLPDFDADGDESVGLSSPKSFGGKGALYTYELQAPYGHELTWGGNIEECDAWSFCDDLVTRCDDNPSICPWWPARCQPRYINWCTPFCQLWCGDGVIDANWLDGLPGTSDDEECDDGNGNDGDGCTNVCLRPFCGDGVHTLNSNRTGENGEWPGGYYEVCDPTSSGQNASTCLPDCTLTWSINAVCNFSFPSSLVYGAQSVEELLDAVESISGGTLCYPRVGGILQNLTGVVNGSWIIQERSRTCQWQEGWQSTECVLPRWACGDGVVDLWTDANGNSANEECDDGNNIPEDGCDAECKREPVLESPSQACTPGSYPQVEIGEYLPVWWLWTRSDAVSTSNETCTNATRNMITRQSIMWQVEIKRGNPLWGTQVVAVEQVPLAVQATAWIGLISGAIADFAPGVSITQTVGTHLFTPTKVQWWVNYQNTPSYGQYQLSVSGMNMDYCALRRTESIGTVSGTITELSDFESCDNNEDDNGDWLIDCADTVRCNPTAHPNCNPNQWWWGSCTTNNDCYDTSVCNGQAETCVSGTCVQSPAPMPWDECHLVHPALQCDDDDQIEANCREAQRQALWLIVSCYEKLISFNYDQSISWWPQCSALSFTQGDPCTMTWCDMPPVAPPASYVWPIYLSMSPPARPTSLPNNYQNLFGNQFRNEWVLLHRPILENMLNAQLTTNFPDLDGITLNPIHGQWFDHWLNNGQSEPVSVPIPPYTPPGWGGGSWGEICGDGSDNEPDWFTDCADGECAGDASCLVWFPGPWQNEDCFDLDASGNPQDNDGDGAANVDDPDCYQFYGEWYQAPTPIGNRTLGPTTYTSSSGALCDAGFSVSKGYFVQQWFAFSEQANTGLDTATFTSIWGISLVAEWTAIDDSLNQIATYQWAWKQYLFDDFIETRSSKAVNPISFSITDISVTPSVTRQYRFLKVPNAQIYFYDGPANAEVLIDDDVKERLLPLGGVAPVSVAETAVTIVLPEVGQKLVVNGSVHGNNLFIAKGNIKFASSLTEWCDGSDVVEWLFVAWGSFETDTIGNKSLNQQKRCKWGNLQIKGTLLWLNAGSQLAPLRRSVLNAWSSGNLLFDDSKVYQARELFETCYLPPLLYKVFWNTATWPMAWCNIGTYNSKKPASLTYMKTNVLNAFRDLLEEVEYYMANECVMWQPCSYGIVEKFIDSLPNKPVNNDGNQNFTAQSIIFLREATYGGPLTWSVTASTMEYIDSRGKVLPLWMVPNPLGGTHTVDLSNVQTWRNMVDYLSRYVEPIKQQFLSFPSLIGLADTPNRLDPSPLLKTGDPTTLFGKLSQIWWTAYTNTFNSVNTFAKSTCLYCLTVDSTTCKKWSYNKFICSVDMKYLYDNRTLAVEENTSRQEQVVEWSSVVILSNPTIWTDLPPGAKDFLNSLSIIPK